MTGIIERLSIALPTAFLEAKAFDDGVKIFSPVTYEKRKPFQTWEKAVLIFADGFRVGLSALMALDDIRIQAAATYLIIGFAENLIVRDRINQEFRLNPSLARKNRR